MDNGKKHSGQITSCYRPEYLEMNKRGSERIDEKKGVAELDEDYSDRLNGNLTGG